MTNPGTSTVCSSCGTLTSGKFCHDCGAPLSAAACRACGATLPVGARFCNACGTSVAGTVGGGAKTPATAPVTGDHAVARYLPWGLAALLLVAVSAYFMGGGGSDGSASGAPGAMAATEAGAVAPFASGGGAGGAPPDLSAMTPRERAGRLYDRIMRYVEQGKKDSAEFFSPMALASFEMLGAELDLDARYDYGRVAQETGHLDIAAAQADTILQQSPTHLLGLALKARTATARNDAATAAKSWQTFTASREAELKKSLPEYQTHATDIERATAIANGGK